MIQGTTVAAVERHPNGIVLICSDPGRRALVEGAVHNAETHSSPVEGLLAVTRRPTRAVIVNLEDVEGGERELLAALHRARPGIPVYSLVPPEDEPLGLRLLREGAADYFVCPRDISRLPQVLEGRGTKPAAGPPDAFRAVCHLVGLAMARPQILFRDGAALILRALGVRRGCAFSCNADTGRLEVAATFGEAADPGRAGTETERAPAELALRTGDVLFVEAGADDAPPGGILCIPVREGGVTHGVVCFSGKADGSAIGRDDRQTAEALVAVLSRLYSAASQREEYARLALRDVETGLLKPEPFLTYLEKLISRAEDQRAELGLLLLEPRCGPRGPDAALLGRLGREIQASLQPGCQAGRLESALFGVVLSRHPDNGLELASLGDFCETATTRLVAAGRWVDASMTLRTALAVYPHDGPTAKALLAAARARLAGGG